MYKRKHNNLVNNKKKLYGYKVIINLFPILILFLLIVGYFVITKYFDHSNVVMYTQYKGYLIGDSSLLDKLSSNDLDNNTTVDTVALEANNYVYKTLTNNYITEDDVKVSINYPYFLNDGLAILNTNENSTLITSDLYSLSSYVNSVYSYGKAYDYNTLDIVDTNNYLLLGYTNNVFINLYDIQIKTMTSECEIPVNSFIAFKKNKVEYYQRENDKFYAHSIDIDKGDHISFLYVANGENYTFKYSTLISSISDISFNKEEPPVNNDEPEKVVETEEEVIEQVIEKHNKGKKNNYVKPTVTSSDLTPNVYTLNGSIKIEDPANVIIGRPTYTIYTNGKIYSRKGLSSTSDFIISGLLPNTTYKVVGTYIYLAEDLTTSYEVTFFDQEISTLDIDTLDPISIDFENGDIYSNKIEIRNLKITSDIKNDAINGINRGVIEIDGVKHQMDKITIVNALKEGLSIDKVYSNDILESNKEYDYSIKFYDISGNEIYLSNNVRSTRTCKETPTVVAKILSMDATSVTFDISLKNKDNIEMFNYGYSVLDSSSNVVKSGKLEQKDNQLVLHALDPEAIFTLKIFADFDVENGKGITKNNILAEVDFSSLPITSLGFLNISISEKELTDTSNSLTLAINENKTDSRLVRLLTGFKIQIKHEGELVKETVLTEEQVHQLMDYELIDIDFDNLNSSTEYEVNLISTVKQGSSYYDLDCVYSYKTFKTKKKTPEISIINQFTSSSMIDFDLKINDIDNVIIDGTVRLEFRDSTDKLVDARTIDTNTSDYIRINYDSLEVNKKYYLYFIANEYNDTDETSTYQSNKVFETITFVTSDGISGNIKLLSAKREPTSENILDFESETKWIESVYSNTIPKEYDSEGNMHIYRKTGDSSYYYDFTDYVGETVTIKFKIKAIQTNGEQVFFSKYMTAWATDSGASHAIELHPSTDEWTSYEFTFVVGASQLTGDRFSITPNNNYYNTNNCAYAGFILKGEATNMLSEYLVKDMIAYVSKDKEEIDTSNIKIEPGKYNGYSGGTVTKADAADSVRTDQGIELQGGYFYRFDFSKYTTDDVNATILFANKSNNKIYLTNNSIRSHSSILVPNDSIAYVSFTGDFSKYDVNLKVYKIPQKLNDKNPKDFKFNYITRVKVNVTDLKDEIADGKYYIRVFDSQDNYIKEFEYDDMANGEMIKLLDLDQYRRYVIKLAVKIRDRYYYLGNIALDTSYEVMGVEDKYAFSRIQPKGHYIVLNDIDFRKFNDLVVGRGKAIFTGEIDFDGHKVIINTDFTTGTTHNIQRIGTIGKSGVIKNLVLELHYDATERFSWSRGFVQSNYGTIENVKVIAKRDNDEVLGISNLGGLVEYNRFGAVVRNFVIDVEDDLDYFTSMTLLTMINYGVIENGYSYGKDIYSPLESTSEKLLSPICMENRDSGKIRNVYVLNSIHFPNNYAKDLGGLVAGRSYGLIENAYVVGDTNQQMPNNGPITAYLTSAGEIKNVYYVSDYIYNMAGQLKLTPTSLTNVEFQKSVLNDNFDYENTITFGYYPHVVYTSEIMPKQEYVELPKIAEDTIVDIVSTKVVDKKNNEATLDVEVLNPYGNTITKIDIANVATEIISSEFEDGVTRLKLKMLNPSVYVSSYTVRKVSSMDYLGYTYEKTYLDNEKTINVDFYREIYNTKDWININNSNNENYILMADIDFLGESKNYNVSYFYGTLNGNGHTIKNIYMDNMGNSGLIAYLSGTIKNLYVENITNTMNQDNAGLLIGTIQKQSLIDNVHIKGGKIECGSARENKSTNNLGILSGYGTYSTIQNSSIVDVDIIVTAKATNLYAGSFNGASSGLTIRNSYARNVNITADNTLSVSGIGLILGGDNTASGNILDVYSIGNISSNGINTGGIAGSYAGRIKNCYSAVNISSGGNLYGGIAGNFNNNYIEDVDSNLYVGNIYGKNSGLSFGKIIPNDGVSASNYALKDSYVDGEYDPNAYISHGETLVTKDKLYSEKLIEEVLSDGNYDLNVNYNHLPKLYYSDKQEYLPNQIDNEIPIDILPIESLSTTKNPDYLFIVMTLDNPDNYDVKSVDISGLNVSTEAIFTNEGKTTLQLRATPEKFYDSYQITGVNYVDNNGEEQKSYKERKIEASFYKYLSTVEDWNNISTTDYENYILANDIDFTGKTVQSGVVFNRLVTDGDDHNYTLKGIDIVFNSKDYNLSLISSINTELKNITFRNITIYNKSTSGTQYYGLIGTVNGNVENCEFYNINISKKSNNSGNTGLITNMNGAKVNNIKLDGVTVSGANFTSGFIVNIGPGEKNYKNIIARNMTIIGTQYTGGIFSQMSTNSIGYFNEYKISDSNIKGTNYVGGIIGKGWLDEAEVTNVDVTGTSYVGGVYGYLYVAFKINRPFENVSVYDSRISGSGERIGGIFGARQEGTQSTPRSYSNYYLVKNSKITGLSSTTKYLGGLGGYSHTAGDASGLQNSAVVDCIVTSLGRDTGGVMGYINRGTLAYTYIDNTTVTGDVNVGGLIGETGVDTIEDYHDNIISRTTVYANLSAGGVIGYDANKQSETTVGGVRMYYLSLEDVNVGAKSSAGGLIGRSNVDLVYPDQNASNYMDVHVTSNDDSIGLFTGDSHNTSFFKMGRMGIYKDTSLNGTKVSDLITEDNDVYRTFTVDTFYKGYLSSGVPTTNSSNMNAVYTEKIQLKAGHKYIIEFDSNYTQTNVAFIAIYRPDGSYVSQLTGSNSYYSRTTEWNGYIGKYNFDVYRDCDISVGIYNSDNINSVKVTEINNTYGVPSSQMILDEYEIRDVVTWANKPFSTNTTSSSHGSVLYFRETYWDYSPLKSDDKHVTVEDLSNNGYTGNAVVDNYGKNGFLFDGDNSYIKINQLPIANQATISFNLLDISVQKELSDLFYAVDANGKYIYLKYRWGRIYLSTNNGDKNFQYVTSNNRDYQLTISWNSSELKLFIDGKKIGTIKNYKILSTGNSNIYIGTRPNPKAYQGYVGRIKAFQYYNVALSDSEVRQLYDLGTPLNRDSLKVYYDLTSYEDNGGYSYPKLIQPTNTQVYKEQRLIPLPGTNSINNSLLGARRLSYSPLSMVELNEDSYKIYSSGIDTLNVEFTNYTPDLKFEYDYHGNTYTTDVEDNILSLYYEFDDDITIRLKDSFTTYEHTYSSDELSNTLSIYGNKYYYIKDSSLYEKDEKIADNIVNLKDGLALSSDHKVYVINDNEYQDYYRREGLVSFDIPISTATIDTKFIETYLTFTKIYDSDGNVAIRDGQILFKNNYLYMFNHDNYVKNNIVFNYYNNKEYQIVLSKTNNIYSIQNNIKLPNQFLNSNIIEIIGDSESDNPIMMVRYDNATVVVFDYTNGNVLYKSSSFPVVSLTSFFKTSFIDVNLSSTYDDSYKETSKVIDFIENANNEIVDQYYSEYDDYTNLIFTDDEYDENGNYLNTSIVNNSSIKNKYVVSLSSSNKYEVYSVVNLLANDDVINESQKIAGNATLKRSYDNKTNSKLFNNRNSILITMLIIILINLSIFIRLFERRKNNETK